eukprot:TRINITY_DN9015_c0_g1_i1.p1 TRINITY_DN9015_c0_g1~~TRINITY_DN9015_c0_g1_i1.p1  ORF type:complete len:310 (+),score=109.06 TRINITY_DN9015_c0_g1_i1:70-999(+)
MAACAAVVLSAACSGALSRADLSRVVLESPRLVGLHDKAGWLSLFADDAVISDPVGSPPSGPDPTERALFYDTFIAPNNVVLKPQRSDIVAVRRRQVVRTVEIDAELSSGTVMRVPVHLHYRINPDGKVAALNAHWQISDNLPVLNSIADAWPATYGGCGAFWNIYAVRGFKYLMGYVSGTMLTGAGSAAKRTVQNFASAVAAADAGAAASLLAPEAVVALPVQDKDLHPARLAEAGITGMSVRNLRGAGKWVTCDITVVMGGAEKVGVGLFEFPDHWGSIGTAELFFDDSSAGAEAAAKPSADSADEL